MKRLAALTLCLIMLLCGLSTYAHALSISIRYDTFRTLESYEAFVSQANLPPDFVHISRFRFIGDLYYANMGYGFHRSYHYEFKDANGQPLPVSIHINHSTTEIHSGSKTLTEIPAETSTLLTVKVPAMGTDTSFCYFRNGVYYIYQKSTYSHSANLKSIEWFADGIHFQIPIKKHTLSQYKSVPLLIPLLSISESAADEAFRMLCKSAGLTPETEHFRVVNQRRDFLILLFNLTATSVVATVIYVLAKKCRARRPATPQSPTAPRTISEELPLSAFTNHESPFDTPNAH